MNDFSNILSGSDNLWKYLFTVGILLIFISIYYPLQKSEEINLEIIELNTDSQILNKKIEYLEKEVSELKYSLKKSNFVIDSLSLKNWETEINKIQGELIDNINVAKERTKELQLEIIKNQGKENYINELQKQSNFYKGFFRIGIIIGFIMVIIGLYKWTIASFVSDQLRLQKLNPEEKEKLFLIIKNNFLKKFTLKLKSVFRFIKSIF